MNQRADRHPGPGEGPGEDLCIAALIRLAADEEELTPEQRTCLERHLSEHPEGAARIEFERGLRAACARACCPCGCAPPDLRERVKACCCAGDAAASAPAQSHARSGSSPLRTFVARFGALAALVVLVAFMGYLVGRSGRPDRTALAGRTFAASLEGFVRAEHDRCSESSPAVRGKFYIHDPAEVPEEMAAILALPVSPDDLVAAQDAGLVFVDAGLCHPPGGDAMHIRFRVGEDPGSPLISLWVQADDGRLHIEEGVTYRSGGDGDSSVLFWRAEGLRYVLVSPEGQPEAVARSALACPGATAPI